MHQFQNLTTTVNDLKSDHRHNEKIMTKSVWKINETIPATEEH